ncbi:hypothetical protein EDD28_0052 [Salana multivorans]|uniref:Uncharacterized protein n=1 Tax=Salana multivorans TaxID=120377 RepID=A0A3N2D6U5_9MICO|nr:hypothetical protein [Salana multivorans]ROR95499.1 hypothetical protein EDD28_0052 [Salana multivorans]
MGATDRERAVEYLRGLYPLGATVTTALHHVSRSGMTRSIAVIAVVDGGPVDVSWAVAHAVGRRLDPEHGGVKVGGIGMDMGFHLAYSLARALYPDGHHCTGHEVSEVRRNGRTVTRCPSNDHVNDWTMLAAQYGHDHPDERDAEWDPGLTAPEARAARLAFCAARAEWIAAQRPRLWSRRRHHSDGGYALKHRWL